LARTSARHALRRPTPGDRWRPRRHRQRAPHTYLQARLTAHDARSSRLRAMVAPAELAELLAVSRRFVYEHKLELGGIPLGSGPKPRWRFDVDVAIERLRALTACSGGRRSQPPEPVSSQASRRRRTARSGTGVELLPIRGAGRAA